MNESVSCTIFLSTFGFVIVLDFGYFNRCIVVLHCCFNCNFQVTYDGENSFICLLVISICSMVVCLFSSLIIFKSDNLYFYFWVFRFLHMFWIAIFYRYVFSKYCLPVCDFLFSWHCLSQTKFLILMKPRISIVSFFNHAFDVVSKKSLSYSRSLGFSSKSSSRNFTVSCFTFISMIHFEFIFENGIRSVSSFIFLCVNVYCASTIYEDYVAPLYFPSSLSNISWHYLYRAISGFSKLFHWCVWLFFH